MNRLCDHTSEILSFYRICSRLILGFSIYKHTMAVALACSLVRISLDSNFNPPAWSRNLHVRPHRCIPRAYATTIANKVCRLSSKVLPSFSEPSSPQLARTHHIVYDPASVPSIRIFRCAKCHKAERHRVEKLKESMATLMSHFDS
jgi:hypothetical protein